MSEIEKYYNGEIIVDFEEETELEKKYNEVAELYSKAVKKKIEYRKEIERLTTELESANESITWWQNRFNAVERDNERLNNIINELEKYIEESYKYNSKCLSTIFEARAFEDNKILEKLQELKGSE